MKKVIMEAHKDRPIKHLLKQGFYSGIGWAAGVTVGFAIISTILITVFGRLGGLPIIGGWIASVVGATTDQLSNRTPILPR